MYRFIVEYTNEEKKEFHNNNIEKLYEQQRKFVKKAMKEKNISIVTGITESPL